MVSDADIARALGAGVVSASWRYERVTKRGTVLQDITPAVVSVNFTEDFTASVLRSADFRLVEDLIDPPLDIDGAIIKATVVYRMLAQDVEFPRGVYRVSAPRYVNTSSHTYIDISGMDLKADLIANESPTTYVVGEGQNYVEEVRFLLDSLGYAHSINGTALVTPVAFTFEPFTPYAEIIDTLLHRGINYYRLYADRDGVFRSRERVAPKDSDPAVLYTTEAEPLLIRGDFQHTRTEQRIANRVSININDPARPAATVNRENGDARSRNSVPNRGASDTYEIKGDRIANAYRAKLPDPSDALESNALCAAFSPDGLKLAVGMVGSPYLAVYRFDEASGIGVRLGGITGGLVPADSVRGLSWNSTSDRLAVAMDASPYVRVYEVSTNAVTAAVANPASLPSGPANDIAWNHGDDYIAAAIRTSPYVEVWEFTAGAWGAKVAAPASPPASYGTGVAWRTGDSHLAVSHYGGQGVSIYPWAAGFGSRIEPGTGAGGNAEAVDWRADGDQFAVVVASDAPNVAAWQWNSGAPIPLGNPDQYLPSYGLDIAYRPLTDDLGAAGASKYNTTVYFGDGLTLNVSNLGGIEGDREGLIAYNMEADVFGTPTPVPSLALQAIQGLAWHPGGLFLALAHYREPYITTMRYQGGNVMRATADYELSYLDTFYETAELAVHFDPRRTEHESIALEIDDREDRTRWLIHRASYSDEPGTAMALELGRALALSFRDFTPGEDS